MSRQRKVAIAVASGLVAAVVFLLGASAAQAFTVLCGATECGPGDTNATAIRGLSVIDQTYDVDFLFDSADDIRSSEHRAAER